MVLRRKIASTSDIDTWEEISDYQNSYEGGAATEILAFARKHIDIPECLKNFYEANACAWFQAMASYLQAEYTHVDGYQAVFTSCGLVDFKPDPNGGCSITTHKYVTASIHHSIDLDKLDTYRTDKYGASVLNSHETVVQIAKTRFKALLIYDISVTPTDASNIHLNADDNFRLFEQFMNYGATESEPETDSDSDFETDSETDPKSDSETDSKTDSKSDSAKPGEDTSSH